MMHSKEKEPGNNYIEQRFRRTDTLTRRKLQEYIPVMILTNMSVFVVSTVDSLVAGNLVSSDALASVQIFSPVLSVISAFTLLVAVGSGTSLSTCMGVSDAEALRRTKNAVRTTMFVTTAIVAVVQFPVIYFIIASYHLTPEIQTMVWQYAFGMMIALPIGIIESVGSYQLTIVGKMKVLMALSMGESIINLLMDLFFVEVMHLGVVGIGFGTAVANVIRCLVTLIYLQKKTDLLSRNHSGVHLKEIKDILRCGAPDAASSMLVAVANYIIMGIIIDGFGAAGGLIKGICFLALSIINIINLGIRGASRPLMGLYTGSGDTKAIQLLMKQCLMITVISSAAFSILMEAFPEFLYRISGVKEIPEGGILSLRLFLPYFVFLGVNALFRLYFANRKDSRFATLMAVIGNVIRPLFVGLLYHFLSAPFIWLAYLITELPIFVMNVSRYKWWIRKDQTDYDPTAKVLFLSVKPEEAVEASHCIRSFAEEHGYPQRVSQIMCLCMEEMVAYAVTSQRRHDIQIQIMVRFSDAENRFVMMDDGACTALDEREISDTVITNNYDVLKIMAKTFEYQYILNMNYTVIIL